MSRLGTIREAEEEGEAMTEQEWLTSSDPKAMVKSITGRNLRRWTLACWTNDCTSNDPTALSERANLLRCIVGNPSRPLDISYRVLSIDWPSIGIGSHGPMCRFVGDGDKRRIQVVPPWLTPTVLWIAKAIYRDRTFGEVGVLADALEDAGCDETCPLVAHLRNPGIHARGCHVIDAILGKD